VVSTKGARRDGGRGEICDCPRGAVDCSGVAAPHAHAQLGETRSDGRIALCSRRKHGAIAACSAIERGPDSRDPMQSTRHGLRAWLASHRAYSVPRCRRPHGLFIDPMSDRRILWNASTGRTLHC